MQHLPAFAVRLDAALKVRPFISKEPTRYYLNGVHVSACPAGGAFCVATDGHRMGVARDEDGLVNQSAIIRTPAILKVEKSFLRPWLVGVITHPNKSRGYIAVVEGKKAEGQEDTAEYAIERVEDCILRIGDCFIDGTFPDWTRVIPVPSPTDTTRTFNRDYLRGFGDSITVTGSGEDSPHLVETTDRDFIGVLMPQRGGKRGIPDWLQPTVSKAA